MDAKKILEKIQTRAPKERLTISVSKDVLDGFKVIAKDKFISPIVDELMREFIESATTTSQPETPVQALMHLYGIDKPTAEYHHETILRQTAKKKTAKKA